MNEHSNKQILLTEQATIISSYWYKFLYNIGNCVVDNMTRIQERCSQANDNQHQSFSIGNRKARSNERNFFFFQVQNCRNGMLAELFRFGFGIHHAGLPRRERLMTEKFFANGHITVLFCTSTLAWGINLPAHAVVIRVGF